MSKKMRFTEDKYYNRDVIYTAGKVYDVPDNMVDRWLKRGGEILEEEVKEEPKPVTKPVFDTRKPTPRPHKNLK